MCYTVAKHPYFEAAIIVIIVLSSVLLAIDDTSGEDSWRKPVDAVFTAVFCLEVVLKVLVLF